MRDFYRDMLVASDPATGFLRTLSGVEVYVFNAGTTVAANIYEGREGAAELTNPFTTVTDGLVEFYAEEGRYDVQYKDTVSPPRTGEEIKLWNAVDPVVDEGDLDAGVAALLIPVGMIAPFGGSVAPTGWKLCDGSPISRLDFNDLFDVISTAYGAGNGTSTFNLPDLRGRVPVGVDGAAGRLSVGTSHNHPDLLGQSGGDQVVTLDVNTLPSHDHPDNIAYAGVADHGHGASSAGVGAGVIWPYNPYFGGAEVLVSGGGSYRVPRLNAGAPADQTGVTSFSHSHGITVNAGGGHGHTKSGGVTARGGSGAHSNMPSYQIVNYIIKH